MKRLAGDPRFGRLIVPAAGSSPAALDLRPGAWAMDNGAYVQFHAGAFVAMLERFYGIPGCLFVAAPDVVGSAERTLARFPFWARLIRGLGFPVALVAQDGLTVAGAPWAAFDVLFIGGTTEYKEGLEARNLMAYASARGIPIHVGRVSTFRRLRYMRRHGVTSFDTSGLSRFPDVMTDRIGRYLARLEREPELDMRHP
jgi:hypothetical protein